MMECDGARPEGLPDPKSEWFVKDEPQRAEAAGFSLSAASPFSGRGRREQEHRFDWKKDLQTCGVGI